MSSAKLMPFLLLTTAFSGCALFGQLSDDEAGTDTDVETDAGTDTDADTDNETDQDTDTGAGPAELSIVSIASPACDDESWTFVSEVSGTVSATLYIAQTGVDPDYAWGEVHTMAVSGSASSGTQSATATLTKVGSTSDVADGSTLFACDKYRKATLTWFFEFEGEAGDSVCGAIGHDPDYVGTVDGATDAPTDCTDMN